MKSLKYKIIISLITIALGVVFSILLTKPTVRSGTQYLYMIPRGYTVAVQLEEDQQVILHAYNFDDAEFYLTSTSGRVIRSTRSSDNSHYYAEAMISEGTELRFANAISIDLGFASLSSQFFTVTLTPIPALQVAYILGIVIICGLFLWFLFLPQNDSTEI